MKCAAYKLLDPQNDEFRIPYGYDFEDEGNKRPSIVRFSIDRHLIAPYNNMPSKAQGAPKKKKLNSGEYSLAGKTLVTVNHPKLYEYLVQENVDVGTDEEFARAATLTFQTVEQLAHFAGNHATEEGNKIGAKNKKTKEWVYYPCLKTDTQSFKVTYASHAKSGKRRSRFEKPSGYDDNNKMQTKPVKMGKLMKRAGRIYSKMYCIVEWTETGVGTHVRFFMKKSISIDTVGAIMQSANEPEEVATHRYAIKEDSSDDEDIEDTPSKKRKKRRTASRDDDEDDDDDDDDDDVESEDEAPKKKKKSKKKSKKKKKVIVKSSSEDEFDDDESQDSDARSD